MMLPVIWTEPANSQLADVYTYISQSRPGAAESQVKLVVSITKNLGEFPEMGRPGRRHGTRELVIPGTPYLVVYRIRLSSVRVLAVMHGAQRWPLRFPDL